jgi:hypothetical protein
LSDYGKGLFRSALKRRERERTRRPDHEAAKRNYPRTTVDLGKCAFEIRSFSNRI